MALLLWLTAVKQSRNLEAAGFSLVFPGPWTKSVVFWLNILSHSSELFIVNASSLFSPALTSLRVPSAENVVPPPHFSQDGVNLKSCAKNLSK